MKESTHVDNISELLVSLIGIEFRGVCLVGIKYFAPSYCLFDAVGACSLLNLDTTVGRR